MNILLLILLIGAIVSWLFQLNRNKAQQREKVRLEQQLGTLSEQEAQLTRQVEQLGKYQAIVDVAQHTQQLQAAAEAEAATLIRAAQVEGQALREQAAGTLRQAQTEAKEIREQAGLKARTLQTQAEGIVLNANHEAARLVAEANRRAEEIAGEALAAARNAAGLEKTIQALKNVINGYGDQYLVPSYTVLDELADEFTHAEAGAELKQARERTRMLVRASTAAQCDYVEAIRRTTAINFVTDAFNGKVDTVLASVKHDNYGTLAQQINDAYALVNHLGKPFKDARITPEYLQARLEELRWATVVHELKLKEREEQRRIKEQIREEEKARRDFERAQREAAKQEDTLQRSIDKIQQQAAKASAEQRATFEAQLRELETKLQAAQEKNQRALSMAQQTKSGHVYIISNIGSFGENVYKIGMTRRLEPLDRVRELGDASVPFEFDVHALLFSEDAPTLERELHKHFLRNQVNKANPRKEFFRVDLAAIRVEIDRLGIEAHWTLTAAAREYRESLAIEQAMANNTLDLREWEKFQLENAPAEVEAEELEL